MKVRMRGRDGGLVVCFINDVNYDPEKMVRIDNDKHDRRDIHDL